MFSRFSHSHGSFANLRDISHPQVLHCSTQLEKVLNNHSTLSPLALPLIALEVYGMTSLGFAMATISHSRISILVSWPSAHGQFCLDVGWWTLDSSYTL